MIDLKGLTPAQLEAYFGSLGEPPYRGRQLFHWLHGRGVRNFDEVTVFPQRLRERLRREATPQVFEVLARRRDPMDGTVKYLFRLADGETVESVLMKYRFGLSACVSSQVGCRMGCRFCASTIGGLVRNLDPGEMAEQVVALGRDLRPAKPAKPGGTRSAAGAGPGASEPAVRRIVVMGMGEPLENLGNVLQFLRLIHEPEGCGIGWRHMTVSTSGLVPGIDALAEEDLPITLAISLHAPTDELRSHLVPLNRKHPLPELMAACRRYFQRTGRRLTFEYVMIDGVNDLPETARELVRLLRGLPCHVNLIPLNDVPGRGLACSSPEAMQSFWSVLRAAGIPATLRRQLGTAIDAACGQLRRREAAEPAPR